MNVGASQKQAVRQFSPNHMAIQSLKLTIFTWQASIISKLEQIHKLYHIHIKYGEVGSSERTLTCISRNRVDIWFSSFTRHQSNALKSPSQHQIRRNAAGVRDAQLKPGTLGQVLPSALYVVDDCNHIQEERIRVNLSVMPYGRWRGDDCADVATSWSDMDVRVNII